MVKSRSLKKTILLVDDDPEMLWVFSKILSEEGYKVITAEGGKKALAEIEKGEPDLVILDMVMPGMDGIQTLKKAKEIDENLLVIILTAYGSIESAVEAIKLGAYDYLTRSIDNERIKIVIKNALKTRSLTRKVTNLQEQLGEKFKFSNIIGNSSQMQKVYELVKRAAPYDITVLLQGETGTGKELIARAIHWNNSRADKPFVAIDCAALPETLAESEIFGYEKGAFTGADRRKLGKIELAEGGTLFLDEVGNLTPATQVKLLRALEERKIEHLGGKKPIGINVRVIAATNVDLTESIKKGLFREDLYYRLNVFSIFLPPLRERKGDVLLLAKHFLQEFNQKLNRDIKGFSPEAIKMLLKYQWPGNVRELKNAVESAVLLADDIILPEHLLLNMQKMNPIRYLLSDEVNDKLGINRSIELQKSFSLKKMSKTITQKVERELIIQVLKEAHWNKRETARILDIDYKTLYNKMNRYSISY
ncbi:MAG: sigma-54 dependent transcriptional regulator [Candidatus Aerophobetes bacterium]|nr:sigma-54 dependent transcriptional regulator [Candidatus Aerophobetes bacterium]